MTKLSKIMALAALTVCMAAPAHAQEAEEKEYQPFPHMFVSLQGGAQTTFTNYDNSKLITPTASVGFGAWFTPVVGARLHVNGAWNKGGLKMTTADGTLIDDKYKYNYITTDLDLMLNLVTLFGKKDYYPLNLYLIGGIGLNTAWNNDDAYALKTYMPMAWKDKRLSHNGRVGLQLDYNICRNLSVNLEVDANSLSDRYNSKVCSKDDWQVTAQLGLAFKFGHKKVKKEVVEPEPEPEPEEIWETRIDTIWYDDVTYKDVTADREIKKEIFFAIRESGVNQDDAQISAVAEFLKGVTEGEITITSYADKGTGNPKLNMGYSKARAEKTKNAFIEKGVDPNLIKKVEWKGDTVQPYPNDNDKNRLSVITGHGVYTEKEKIVTKKFRTEEVRYRVQ